MIGDTNLNKMEAAKKITVKDGIVNIEGKFSRRLLNCFEDLIRSAQLNKEKGILTLRVADSVGMYEFEADEDVFEQVKNIPDIRIY